MGIYILRTVTVFYVCFKYRITGNTIEYKDTKCIGHQHLANTHSAYSKTATFSL